jgi:hypothetical protein
MLERFSMRCYGRGMTKPKRPRDTNQLAHMIAQLATGELDDIKTDDGKDPAAVSLGRRGGLKGGKARAKSLSVAKRKAIAQKAAAARWNKSHS